MKKDLKRVFLTSVAVFLVMFLLVFLMKDQAKACDFELDQGIAWVNETTYYMPAEVSEITQNGVEFRGSNGIIYEAKFEDFGAISDDFVYLLTMDSNGTHYWWDDEILVVWRA